MVLKDYFQFYKDELEMIQAQNRVECDLYSLIAHIIRSSKQGDSISLRDVSTRRETVFSKPFKGDSGFPDFVIRSRVKSQKADILGAVEIKYITVNLDNYLEQLTGHVQFYGNVIYTNGLEWRYYNANHSGGNWRVSLGVINKGEIIWNDDEKWVSLLEELDKLNWL